MKEIPQDLAREAVAMLMEMLKLRRQGNTSTKLAKLRAEEWANNMAAFERKLIRAGVEIPAWEAPH